MKIRTVLPAVAATMIMSVAGIAVAESGGVHASAAAATEAAVSQDRNNQDRRDRDRNRDRRDRDQQRVIPNQTSTFGAGQVTIERDRARATVASGAAASAPGATSASSTVDAYGETTRQGSSADIYGNSTANADEPRRERRRPQ